jgi:pyridoxine 4-dehydrogenase
MLSGQFKSLDDLPKDDMRRTYPRFHPDNFNINLELVKQLEMLARQKGCTPAQLAIAWVQSLSTRPNMPTFIPIPGATTEARVRENGVQVKLTEGDLDDIQHVLDKFEVVGDRYPTGWLTDG